MTTLPNKRQWWQFCSDTLSPAHTHFITSIKLHTSSESFHRSSHTPQSPSRHYACLLCFQLPYFLCFSFQLLPFTSNHSVRKFTGLRLNNSPHHTHTHTPLLLFQLSKHFICFCFQCLYGTEVGICNNDDKQLCNTAGKKKSVHLPIKQWPV